MTELLFNHLGLATKHLVRAQRVFAAMGYSIGEVSHVPPQRVNVCFVQKPGHPTIELIEPVDEDSPAKIILDKCGSGLYHLCYSTHDLEVASLDLLAQKFMVVGSVFESGPLGNQRTCFFYSASIGLIEVTEEK